MIEIITPNKLIDSISIEKQYEITEYDIKQINNIITKLFQEEWRIHPDAKHTLFSNFDVAYGYVDSYVYFCELIGWTNKKANILKNDLEVILKNVGYITYWRRGHGCGIQIKNNN